MKEPVVAVVRCGGERHGKAAPKLAEVVMVGGHPVLRWSEPVRDSVHRNNANESLEPLRTRVHRRADRLWDLLDWETRLASGEKPAPLIGYMQLQCRSCGTVSGPLWRELAESARAPGGSPATFLARRLHDNQAELQLGDTIMTSIPPIDDDPPDAR